MRQMRFMVPLACLLTALCSGAGVRVAHAARYAVADTVEAQAQAQPQTRGAEDQAFADRPELLADAPPPTSWDRRHEEGVMLGTSPDKIGDNQSMLAQLVRTLVALCGILFLLWAFARVIGPRMARALGNKRALGMQVTDRLSLDGRNTLVRVTLNQGQSYLIACGDHQAQLIDKLPSDAARPEGASSASRQFFAERMGPVGKVTKVTGVTEATEE